jgi:hypothetical protein
MDERRGRDSSAVIARFMRATQRRDVCRARELSRAADAARLGGPDKPGHDDRESVRRS